MKKITNIAAITSIIIIVTGTVLLLNTHPPKYEAALTTYIQGNNYSEISSTLLQSIDTINTKLSKAELPNDQTEHYEAASIEKYYGAYRITQFCPTRYYSARAYAVLPEQEADMLIGRTVIIDDDLFITYDSERALGTKDERPAFTGNYIIQKYSINAPQYAWEALNLQMLLEEIGGDDMQDAIGKEYFDGINGRITTLVTTATGKINEKSYTQYFSHEYYTMEDENKLIMYSEFTHQYFILEKLNEIPEPKEAVELTWQEKREILENMYGTYTVTKFLPTKFYPALDPCGDTYLPREEADLMLGKSIIISKYGCILYDNFRQPNSEFVGRAMDEYLLEQIMISPPEYQIDIIAREDIYGLRDNMLSEDMTQAEYTQLSVYPGYVINSIERALPQFYLLNDECLIMYSMGEYFLLKKEPESQSSGGLTDDEYALRKQWYSGIVHGDMEVGIDYDYIEFNHKVLNYNICTEPREDYNNTALEEYLRNDIEEDKETCSKIDIAVPLTIDYFTFDFNDDGLEDYLVCYHGSLWAGSGGNVVKMFIQENDMVLKNVLDMNIRLIGEPHAPIAVLDEKTDGCYAIVLPGSNHILRYDKDEERYISTMESERNYEQEKGYSTDLYFICYSVIGNFNFIYDKAVQNTSSCQNLSGIYRW